MTAGIPPIVLASASPRRAQLLSMLGLEVDVRPADVDESYRAGEDGPAHARRLATEKAAAVAALRPDGLVIGSDTVVLIDGQVLGKPRDAAEAVAMLLRLQGRTHIVATGIALASPDGQLRAAVETVHVKLRPFDASLATAYVATGEPLDKAGAYGIQGLGSALVERIEGDYFAVMGLPVVRLLALLEEAGWRYTFSALERVL
jgi:septum formation protein